MYDSWWQNGAIDVRTGLIANAQTQTAAVRSGTRLVLPADEIRAWTGMQAWAARYSVNVFAGTPTVGTTDTTVTGPLIAEIRSPAYGQVVAGQITITGRAASDGFQRYMLQWGHGTAPAAWYEIASSSGPVVSGALAQWDTRAVPNGEYTIRLLVVDGDLGTRQFMVHVRVANAVAVVVADQSAKIAARITSPGTGGEVTGPIAISGSAGAEGFVGYQVQAGEGVNPDQWMTLALQTVPVQNGRLATWDTTGTRDGVWTIRLTVSNAAGQQAVHEIQVVIRTGGN
jgi:hypothetical protein